MWYRWKGRSRWTDRFIAHPVHVANCIKVHRIPVLKASKSSSAVNLAYRIDGIVKTK
jgi:hypothetical protein